MATVKGIDVASFQSLHLIEGLIRNGEVDFGFVKATEGAHYTNPIYAEQMRLFTHHGIPVGLYHFLRHDVRAKDQWSHFEEIVFAHRHSMIIAVDDEADESGHFAPRQLVKDFVKYAHRRGYKIGRYASLSTFHQGTVGADWRWIAFWSDREPDLRWRFWQQKGTGVIDRNVFNGNKKQLHRFWIANTRRA